MALIEFNVHFAVPPGATYERPQLDGQGYPHNGISVSAMVDDPAVARVVDAAIALAEAYAGGEGISGTVSGIVNDFGDGSLSATISRDRTIAFCKRCGRAIAGVCGTCEPETIPLNEAEV